MVIFKIFHTNEIVYVSSRPPPPQKKKNPAAATESNTLINFSSEMG